jgi:hypothetical protein
MGANSEFALRKFSTVRVRFGSLADISKHNHHVRFTPKSGHSPLTPYDMIDPVVLRFFVMANTAPLYAPA